jgi:DNA-binding transcriptional ArsR family regulator
LSEQLSEVFAALADPTRRMMVRTLIEDGWTSVPALSGSLPISRQAVAKHMAALDEAGLVERMPGQGREVRYRLRGEALTPAAQWLGEAQTAWEGRLARLKQAVEEG